MIKLVTHKTMLVGPTDAKHFLEINTFKEQRFQKQQHIDKLVKKIVNGLWTTGDIAVAKLNYSGGQYVLVNGQHQSAAIVKTGKSVPANYALYQVDDAVDLSTLYRQFDNNRVRTLGDSLRPESAAWGIEWPTRIQSLVTTAAAIKENKQTADKEEKVCLLKNYIHQGDFITSILAPDGSLLNSSKHLCRGHVALAMMLTWERNRGEAHEFWCKVRDGEGLTKKSPAFKLRDYLKEVNPSIGSGSRSYKKLVAPHEMLYKCIIAWNAYRKGVPTALQYYPDKPIPRAL